MPCVCRAELRIRMIPVRRCVCMYLYVYIYIYIKRWYACVGDDRTAVRRYVDR